MPHAQDSVPYLEFAIALFLGALVGIEREKSRPEHKGGTAGIRTFILFAEAGAVGGWLAAGAGAPWILAVTVAAVGALVVAGYVAHVRADPSAQGLTTEIAAIVVCLLGAAATTGHRELAVALGIVTSAVLAFRGHIHGLVARIGVDDIYAGLKLLLASFVVLPLVPDRTIDPWDVVNPYRTWWLVVLISGMSFLGYVAVRILGATRGLLLTGLFGGLVSSTAITLSFARRSSEDEQGRSLSGPLASAVLLAWGVMFVRVPVAIAIVHPPLLTGIWLPMAVMAVVTLGFAAFHVRRSGGTAATPDVPLRNPFQLTAAVKFALLFTVILALVRAAQQWAPHGAIYAIAALAGATDVDAISLSMADYAKRAADVSAAPTAAAAIVVAVLSNTLVKAGMSVALGSPGLRNRVVAATGALLVAGAASLVWARG